MTRRIILYRDRIAGKWLATYPDGVTIDTSFVSAAKAGDVARIVARTNPGSQIVVKSSDARAWRTQLDGRAGAMKKAGDDPDHRRPKLTRADRTWALM